MTDYGLAKRASRSRVLSLHGFSEFVGTGVVPLNGRGRDMAVAVYVSKPTEKLSHRFVRAVPSNVEVRVGGEMVRVPTKIVDVGDLKVSMSEP